MAFQDYTAEVLSHVPECGINLAGRLVNRAWQEIRDSRLWSWLTFEGVFVAPKIIGQAFNVPASSQGTVTVTQYSATVNLSTAANSALNNLTNPLITLRQFRAGPINGGVYNIISYSNALATLTLDRIYQESSGTGVPYQVYRCYYSPCDANGAAVTDFLSFISMTNPDLGYRISRSHLRTQRVEIDNMDPLRADQGLAYYVATYKTDPKTGIPIYELWPHPTQSSGYTYMARRRGIDMSLPSDDIPLTLSKSLLMERTLYYVCEWAGKQTGRFPQLRQTNWQMQMAAHSASYLKLLAEAKRQDDEIFSEMYIPSQWADDAFLDEDMQVSTFLSTQSSNNWRGG